MKIVKLGKIPKKEVDECEEANKFCHTCPVCFESTPQEKYWYKGIMSKGIKKTVLTTQWRKGFHKYRGTITAYTCLNCETEWESEPYNVKELNWFGWESK